MTGFEEETIHEEANSPSRDMIPRALAQIVERTEALLGKYKKLYVLRTVKQAH